MKTLTSLAGEADNSQELFASLVGEAQFGTTFYPRYSKRMNIL